MAQTRSLGPIRITPTDDALALSHELNRKLARDKRVECVLLPIADGLQLCRKL